MIKIWTRFTARRLSILPAALLGLFVWGLVSPLVGQNTGTVFSPDVDMGEKELEGRFAYDPDSDSFSKRLHYQYGFTDAFRLRGIATFRSDDVERGDFRYVRLEGQYQFLEDDKAGFDSALRAELQIADGDDPPSRVRLAWTNKYDLNDDWQIRGIFLTGHQFGPESEGGYLLELRGQVSRKMTDSFKLAIDYYGGFNNTNEVGGFDEQSHQIGPLAIFKLNKSLTAQLGVLFGASEAAADTEFRLFVTQAF